MRRSAILLLLPLLAGCPPVPEQGAYLGPTEPMATVVARINANNAAIPSLWARHYFEASIVEKDKTTFVNGSGVLMALKPRDMYFEGVKEGVGVRLVEMGSTDELFWLSIPQRSTAWLGRHRNVGHPAMRDMPVRPDLVMEVLGIGQFDANFLSDPAPTMRFNNDQRVYMFVWSALGADRWIAQKEIWYDMTTLLPVKVLLFDANGRVVVRANLSRHRPVEVDGTPQDKWPKVATDFRLFFPDTRSKLWIELTKVELQHNGRPKPGGIRYVPDTSFREVWVDAECK